MATKSGDVCPHCRSGRLGVVNSKDNGQYQVRYLRCGNCQHKDKEILLSGDVRRRKPKASQDPISIRAYRHGIGPKTRFDVLKRGRFCCAYCGQKAPDVRLHVDHVMPLAKGGTNDISNLVASCERCNVGKGAQLP